MTRFIVIFMVIFTIMAADIAYSSVALSKEVKKATESYEKQIDDTIAIANYLFERDSYHYDRLIFLLSKDGINLNDHLIQNGVIVKD